jgi:hypothetical protein
VATDTQVVEASVGQRLLWLLEHYRGRGGALNVPMVWRIKGALDRDGLQRALDDLVARHETLRTTYRSKGRRLLALVHEPAPLPIAFADLSARSDPEGEALLAMHTEAATGIDPTVWPTRARLWRIAPDDHLFFLNIHHLASDASSNRLLSRDMTVLYDRALGLPVAMAPVQWQYAQWAAWQREALTGDGLARLQRYWTEKLTGALPVALPQRASEQSTDETAVARQERYDLDAGFVEDLRRTAREHRTTLFPVALAVLFAQLHRLGGERDLSVASLFANRRRPEVAETVGFFVNMLILRVALDPEAGFDQLIRACRSTLIGALAHIDLPYQMLAPGTIRAPADAGAMRVDDLVFQFIDAFGDESTSSGLEIDGIVLPLNQTRFALELVFVLNDDDECFINLRFDERRFERAWARGFLEDYVALARALIARPYEPVAAG